MRSSRTRAVKLQNDKGNTKVLLKLTIKRYISIISAVLFDKGAFLKRDNLSRRNENVSLYSTDESQSYWFSVTSQEVGKWLNQLQP